jgi:hypothetical protein
MRQERKVEDFVAEITVDVVGKESRVAYIVAVGITVE